MRPTVLIVEDDPILVELYDEVLSDICALHCAMNLEQAIQVISREQVDVMALDYHLGPILGLSLLEWVHQHRPELLPRSVILSGDPQPELRGFDVPVMCKPVDMDDLIRFIERTAASGTVRSGG